MKTIKLRMFGKYSVSSLFFWSFILCFILTTPLFIAMPFSGLLRAFFGLLSFAQIALFFTPKVIFFYLLILIFKSFKTETIFTKKTINYLHLFAGINFIIALLIIVSTKLDIYWVKEMIPIFPFVILGIFSAFIAAIFKQGFQIQQENELTI